MRLPRSTEAVRAAPSLLGFRTRQQIVPCPRDELSLTRSRAHRWVQFTASLTLPMGIGVDEANVVTEVDPEGAGGQAGLEVGGIASTATHRLLDQFWSELRPWISGTRRP